MKLRERAGALKWQLPALYLALRRRDTPWTAKLLAGATVVYALSPVDLIPDFIPVLGLADDLVILPLLAALTVRLIPERIWRECRTAAEGMWAEGRPKRWYYALPTIAVWLLLLWLLLRAVGR